MSETAEITRFVENPRDLVSYVQQTKDFVYGFEVIKYVHQVIRNFDGLLDIWLKGFEEVYVAEENEGETFLSIAARITGLSHDTIYRHTKMGRMIDLVPEEYQQKVSGLGTKSKVYLSDTVLEGYELREDQWQRVANSAELGDYAYQEVGEVVREVKNVEPRSNWSKYTIDEHGIIWYHNKFGVFEWARLNTDEDPMVKNHLDVATEKARRKLGISPRVRY